MPKVTIELSQTVYSLLEVLTKDEVVCDDSVASVIETLIDHAQQGVYRPGSWERGWLKQVFPGDWNDHLESGDPYGRPDSPMFRRPKKRA